MSGNKERVWISEEVRKFLARCPLGGMCWEDRELGADQGRRCASSVRLWITPGNRNGRGNKVGHFETFWGIVLMQSSGPPPKMCDIE